MDLAAVKELWPDWEIGEIVGQGSFSTVYCMRRKDDTSVRAALKACSIPSSQEELTDLLRQGMPLSSAREYVQKQLNSRLQEIDILKQLRDTGRVVVIEDYKVLPQVDGVGYDVLIQMEYLESLEDYMRDHKCSQQDIVNIGIEVCAALELCEQYGIIHRDVKPANIFVDTAVGNTLSEHTSAVHSSVGHTSSAGHLKIKLGDFGMSGYLLPTTSSIKGTPGYIAPEVYMGKQYDARADQYSLGLVLYQYLNKDRLPFYPLDQQLITHEQRADAFSRRISGEPLPNPCEADDAMAKVILRACDSDPEKRYGSISFLRDALGRSTQAPVGSRRSRRRLWIALAVVVCAIAISTAILLTRSTQKPQAPLIQSIEITGDNIIVNNYNPSFPVLLDDPSTVVTVVVTTRPDVQFIELAPKDVTAMFLPHFLLVDSGEDYKKWETNIMLGSFQYTTFILYATVDGEVIETEYSIQTW